MAFLVKRKDESQEIRWRNRSIYLGKRPLADCELWLDHIEHILDRKESGRPMARETEEWVESLSDRDRKRLADKGLCESLASIAAERLFGLLKVFAESKAKLKASSIEVYSKVIHNLKTHFRANPRIDQITEEDANEFWTWLNTQANRVNGGPLAPATATKRMEQSRDIFSWAKRKKMFRGEVNPFAKQHHWEYVKKNPKRKIQVSDVKIAKVVAEAPTTQWKLFILLSRYQALRTPSEILRLKWSDVDWENKELFLGMSKKKERKMPIFPEVLPLLEQAYDEAPEGTDHVIHKIRYENPVNYANHMERFLRLAGVIQWPRLWHNLRMTRQSELMAKYPIHTVCEWLGNSTRIALDHYAQPLPSHVKKATEERTTEIEFT